MPDVPPRPASSLTRRATVFAVACAGVVLCAFSFRESRARERERAEAEFKRRATIRHTLTREVMARYEEALHGLNTLFAIDEEVTYAEFRHAVQRIESRMPGAQAYEWVPAVPRERRAEAEAELQRQHPERKVEFTENNAQGQQVRAGDRPLYYPIAYLEPVTGNEAALGYDLAAGPSRNVLAQARESGRIALTRQLRLVQEQEEKYGVVMILPTMRPPSAPGEAPAFLGFVQAVFRVHDLLERTRISYPDTSLDMLYVDASEQDPALRILYHRPADDAAPRTPPPSEEAYRLGGPTNELAIPIGGRDWRVIYRPRERWIDEQYTALPWVRSFGVLLLTALVGGLVHTLGRRNEIIQRVVAERTAELEANRRQLDSFLHALPGMAFRCRYDDRMEILFVSEGSLALTGYPGADFVAGTIHFRDLIHPDDLPRVRATTRGALADRRDFEIEYRMRHRAGGVSWVLVRGRGVYDAAGKLDVFDALAIDITAQKLAETERLALERKLLEGQKLESLGLLAGGVAHDFNNLLSSILGNASMTRLALPPGSPSEVQLRAVETAALRAAELCRQMLAYAGKGQFVVEPTDLTPLVEDLLPLLNVSIAKHALLDLHLARGLPPVMADATQLRQIVMNLVLNAVDAIGGRDGVITITTGVATVDAGMLTACVTGAGLVTGEYVLLEVRDTGAGMPPEVLAKIFDPFFTTKFAGRGLGLAAVLGIVRSHGGALGVTSRPGAGTTFRLYLPPAKGAAPASRASDATANARRTFSGRVLVIEDEDDVREITGAILKSFGLKVASVADGQTGVALYRENPSAFDLVVLDLMMPGLSGEQTLAALRTIHPGIGVLIMSGYSEGDILRRLAGPGPLRFLAKPFTRDGMEKHLRELLG